MIKNYLKSAMRNIKRHPFISFINIFGLTVGLTCCLLITTYVINERSYDKFNKNAADIYRVTRTFLSADGAESLHLGSVAPPFGPLLQSAFPDIREVIRVYPDKTTVLRYKDKLFSEKNACYAEQNFFDFFSVQVLKGDRRNGLAEAYSIMITPEIARKYFGDADPINKSVVLDNNKHAFKVSGVFGAFPGNSHLHPNILMSFNTLKDTSVYGDKELTTKFNNNAFYTYLLFPKNYSIGHLETQLPNFLDNYVHFHGVAANFKTHTVTKLSFQKLTDIHLRSHLDSEIEENGDISRVYIFSAIAFFILLIACINYMNLSTSRSILRAREIGIRKVIGARRNEIIRQFLSESVIITLIALLLALILAALLIPLLNKLSSQSLSFNSLLQWHIILPVIVTPFIIGLISGTYPALFMSSFKPVKVLKGLISVGSGNVSFRKVLVVVQFSISIILIVATTVVYRQLRYIQDKKLGFDKDHILTMNYVGALNKNFNSFKTELQKNPGIKEVARSSYIPSERLLSAGGADIIENGTIQPVKIDLKYITMDYGFLPTYGMHLVAGRNFSAGFTTDTNNFLVNETAVRALGWKNPQNALGKGIKYDRWTGKIIGVVKDFQSESLHQSTIPLLFELPADSYYSKLSVKIAGKDVQSAISTLKNTWNKYLPESPFEYTFLDEKFGQLYRSEQLQGSLFAIFSCIAIFIACLGLFGLSAFTITQRVKEIGVRKVLGASVAAIVAELSKDFLKLVLAAAVLAFPIAWWSMSRWLVNFAFHISIGWWVFVMAGFIALFIAFATIGFQSVKAALANPVKSLRSE